MQYDEARYFAEDIGDFHIRSMDKRYKYSSLESLEEFDRICKKYNIKYFAYYGTLLGAIRHKGFIPWDDDIDVIMFREEFNRFLKVAPGEIRDEFELVNVEESAIYPLRVANGTNIRLEQAFLNRFHGCPYPTGIDVYVLDKLPQTQEERDLLRMVFELTRYMAQYNDDEYEKIYNKEKNEDENDVSDLLDALEGALGINLVRDNTLSIQLTTLCNRLAAIYNDTDSDIVTRMEIWSTDGKREMMPIECFESTVDVEFEGMILPAPIGYDELLTRIYGDYMTPVMGGGAHAYRNYQENEDILFGLIKANGDPIPEFLLE